jgi:hypothetical protein
VFQIKHGYFHTNLADIISGGEALIVRQNIWIQYRGFPSSCNEKSEKRSRVQATSKDWACAVSLFTFVQLQDLGKPL